MQWLTEEVSQKKIPISYNIFFCGTSSTSVAEEEAPATEEYTLRFILPCKSDCQPIFLKKQGIYSLYAKL